MALPTSYYEEIIRKLGGDPASLPDRCDCTMIDYIITLIETALSRAAVEMQEIHRLY